MKRQRGLSLISLLIGLLLATLSLMAMVSLYRGTVKQNYGESGAVRRVSRDTQLDNALMTAGVTLQNAGFGVVDGNGAAAGKAGTDLVVLSGMSLASNSTLTPSAQPVQSGHAPSGNTVLWRSQENGSLVCQGLLASPDGNVWLLQSTRDCTLAPPWSAITFTALPLLSGKAVGAGSAAVTFSVGDSSCWPYNSSTTVASGPAAASAPLKATLLVQDSQNGDVAHTVCLNNLIGWSS